MTLPNKRKIPTVCTTVYRVSISSSSASCIEKRTIWILHWFLLIIVISKNIDKFSASYQVDLLELIFCVYNS